MSVHWRSYPDAHAAAVAAAQHILTLLENALVGQERATLAVSGGSTPKLLFEELVKSRYNWERVHLFWVDERAVPPADRAAWRHASRHNSPSRARRAQPAAVPHE